jgi:NADPH-dependent 2,4-dienoyl-CoA reductase/sulfur reductase-like enzyme/rhodanese-related sulfurtransferase
MTEKTRIVIIGGVAGGTKAAARARRRDANAEITLIEKGRYLSYAGCGMPYAVSGDIPDVRTLVMTSIGVPRDAAYFFNVKNINVLTLTLAERINRADKTVDVVNIETGERKTLPYDKLVIATGATPIEPPIEGLNLNNVIRMNQLEDAMNTCELLNACAIERAVIIGSGYIGLEMAEAFVKRGMKVTVVEMLPQVLPRMLDPEMAAFVTKHMRAKGVDVRLNEQVAKIVGDDENNVRGVVTSKGETIPATLVLVAVGVRPNVKLAKDAGLALGAGGAIAVNEYLQTSDPDIYAGGDCAENTHLVTGKKAYVPLGSTANKHGRVIGDNVTGGQSKFAGVAATSVLKVFDFNVGKTGLNEREAKEAGYDVVTGLNPSPDASPFYPGNQTILIKVVADRQSGKLLGVEGAGPGDVIKRIDVAATAIGLGASVEQLANLDLGYAPPYSSAIDTLAHTANIVRNKMEGLVIGVSPMEVKAKIDRGEDFVLLDVRTPGEYEQQRIADPRVKLIPLGLLRKRHGELPRDKEIVLFCKISLRGYEAYTILAGVGFSNLKMMDGGIVAWPYQTTSGKV